MFSYFHNFSETNKLSKLTNHNLIHINYSDKILDFLKINDVSIMEQLSEQAQDDLLMHKMVNLYYSCFDRYIKCIYKIFIQTSSESDSVRQFLIWRACENGILHIIKHL